jgi:hypothetical protein
MKIRTVFRSVFLITAFKYQRLKQTEVKVTLVKIAVFSKIGVIKDP